jgi:hypothetical protein
VAKEKDLFKTGNGIFSSGIFVSLFILILNPEFDGMEFLSV